MLTRREALAVPAALLLPSSRAAQATDAVDPTRLFAEGEKSADARLGPYKLLTDYFPFAVPATKAEWEARRKLLRERVLVAEGLWPMPERTPLNAVVHGKIERERYTIEKVSFASRPGHYVTGNLYRPTPVYSRPLPAVLFAHGHWKNGRFHDAGEAAAKASVAAGGEADLERGRFFMQALPATLARLGCVVFQYDMVGYADSTAIPHREGFKDAQAELRLQSFMGLQTWNGVRALDFLLSLPGVDPKRVGMTGASGGGTQTFVLGAIDDRLTAAFPAVMVSTGMQGGCVCENCSLLRVGTGNVELAALFAPKPLAMSAANDWTKELIAKGLPELQGLYALYGAGDKVAARAWLEFGHQYNQKAREFMYAWFSKHLLDKDEQPKEAPIAHVPPAELSVYDGAHPRPKDELGAADLRDRMSAESDAQMRELFPTSPEKLKAFRDVVGPALRAMACDERPKIGIGKGLPKVGKVDGVAFQRLTVGRASEGDAVPTCLLNVPAKDTVVWAHPRGKASLFQGGKLVPAARKLVEAGFAVVAPDLFQTGEQVGDKPRAIDGAYAGFTYGYNRSLLAERVHDLLTLVRSHWMINDATTVHLVGWGEFGPVAVLAKALAGYAATKLAADLNGFRFENVRRADDPMLLPGAVKYGGLGAFLALCAPGPALVHNAKTTGIGRMTKAAYESAGARDQLTVSGDKLDDLKVVEWLVR